MVFSIGVFINSESDIERLNVLAQKGINCHLAFMHYNQFREYSHLIPKNLRISSLHGFNSEKGQTFLSYINCLIEFKEYFEDYKVDNDDFRVTLHPNHFGKEFAKYDWIYPEVFPYKKKKKLRTPLDILRTCGQMTLDTSHLDEDWLSESMLRSLISNSNVLHFSQRTSTGESGEHKPINFQGDIPTGLIIRILKQIPVDEVVLEYMPCFFHNAIKDYAYLCNTFKNQYVTEED